MDFEQKFLSVALASKSIQSFAFYSLSLSSHHGSTNQSFDAATTTVASATTWSDAWIFQQQYVCGPTPDATGPTWNAAAATAAVATREPPATASPGSA